MEPIIKELVSVGNNNRKDSGKELQSFGKDIWTVDGPNVRDMFLTFTTRMSIVKLIDGSLWINSPVPVSFDVLNQITTLGSVKYLLSATPRHVWRLDLWHTLFPNAQLWVPQKSPFTVKKGNLSFTGILGDEPYEDWANDFDQLVFKGNPLIKEVFFYHKASKTVILDDLIQIHPIINGHPFLNAFLKLEGVSSPYGGVGLDLRFTFTNRNKARQSLKKLLSWDFDKLIIAHGVCVENNAKAFIEKAFHWL